MSRTLGVENFRVNNSVVVRVSGDGEIRCVPAMRVSGTVSAVLNQLVQAGTYPNRARECQAQNQIAGGELLYPFHVSSQQGDH